MTIAELIEDLSRPKPPWNARFLKGFIGGAGPSCLFSLDACLRTMKVNPKFKGTSVWLIDKVEEHYQVIVSNEETGIHGGGEHKIPSQAWTIALLDYLQQSYE